MTARELIERKKRGQALRREEIAWLVDGFTAGRVPAEQMSAFLMAVWFRGLDRDETSFLLDSMMRSGRVLDLSDVPGPKIDKHSTGGIGDKVSLPLAGIAAACGLRVPMVSGRGLGHTGGTLDKLAAIPGYDIRFDEERYRRMLREVGATIVGQSDDLVPADRALYALRDVTGTVDCVPLIVTSILSKKFASGAEGVVMDVKVGSGAFMRDITAARTLAEALVDAGRLFGRAISVLFTRMDEPLGVAVGHAVEVVESLEMLRGGGPEDLREVTLELAGEMLRLGRLAPDAAAGRRDAERAVASGEALRRFLSMVQAQGGRLLPERPDGGLELAPRVAVVEAPRRAFLAAVDGYEVGTALVELGGGRERQADRIDPAVGLRWLARIGQRQEPGDVLFEVLARPGQDVGGVVRRLQAAVRWSEAPVGTPPRVLERLPWEGR
jgi:pyrimidine-nucleoside phosphorylase/thymidine phosphorylase